MTETTFAELDLLPPILRAIREEGYDQPTPIQGQAIPHLLDGRDLLGIAQTGTGKTAAFALPILDFLAGDPRPPLRNRPSVLVLTPTRELAAQIGESFEAYGRHTKVRQAVVFGGVGQSPQVAKLRAGVDVLVATPGRLLDLIDQGHLDLGEVEVFVLDEADRMLDMGFLDAIKKVIAKLPRDRQSLLFSATMPAPIARIADSLLRKPVRVEVTPPATTVERIEQTVLFVEKGDKRGRLLEVLGDRSIERVLVFTRTKHGADRVAKHLRKAGETASVIHGNKSQRARELALDDFKRGAVRVLVATDIAARGIDIDDITHVINFDLPNIPESYVHRIGRTARAGRDGAVISFCATDERPYLRDIEKTIGRRIGPETLPPANAADEAVAERGGNTRQAPRQRSGGGGARRGRRKSGGRSRGSGARAPKRDAG